MGQKIYNFIYKIVSIFLVFAFLLAEMSYSYAQPIHNNTLSVQSTFSSSNVKAQKQVFSQLIDETIRDGITKGHDANTIKNYCLALLEHPLYKQIANHGFIKRKLIEAVNNRDLGTANVLTLLINTSDRNLGTILVQCPKGDYTEQAELFKPFIEEVSMKLQGFGNVQKIDFLVQFIFQELLPNIAKHARDNLAEDVEHVFGFFSVEMIEKEDGKYVNFYVYDNGGGMQIQDTPLRKGLLTSINASAEGDNLEEASGRGLFIINQMLFCGPEKPEFYFQSQGKRVDIVGIDGEKGGKVFGEINDTDFSQGFCAEVQFKLPAKEFQEQPVLGKAKDDKPSHWIEEKPIYQVMLKDYVYSVLQKKIYKAVTKDIPILAQKNIGTLWLTGAMQNFGATTPFEVLDPMAIEDRYGTMEDLQELIKCAHEHGIKVIIDFIPNHVSMHSSLVKNHPEWFLKDEQGNFVDATDNKKEGYQWKGLVQFDYLNHEVIQYLHDVGKYWINLGFDGFRLDTPLAPLKKVMIDNWYSNRRSEVDEVFQEEFWATFIKNIRQIRPDAGFIAETLSGEKKDELLSLGVDLVYDSGTSSLLYEIIKGQKGKRANDLQQYISSIKEQLFHSVHFKDGHDIRDVGHQSDYGIEKLRTLNERERLLAMVMILALPGVPMFFNGELEAIEDYRYVANAASPIPWDKVNIDLKGKYIQLLEKLNTEAFRKGEISFPTKNGADDLISFVRNWNDEIYLVAANLSNLDNGEKQWMKIFLSKEQNIDPNKRYVVMDHLTENIYGVYKGQHFFDKGLDIGVTNHEFQILKIIEYTAQEKKADSLAVSSDSVPYSASNNANRPNKNNDPQDLLDHDDEEDVYIAQIVEEPITKGELSLYREA
ncbi:MAG: alpha-amylase family glycosyl hydrolase, partial [Candidatus Omnitrophica bacterium]|nr:alpha-amylase family glycosyl hydrolase [Candidatus Omnitrophota bacterium]